MGEGGAVAAHGVRKMATLLVVLSLLIPVSARAGHDPGHACLGSAATVVGTVADDVLVGTDGPDVIVGAGGDDTITGLGEDDMICAGDGDDSVEAGAGVDLVLGGPHADEVVGGLDDDYVYGGPGNDLVLGLEGDDLVRGGPEYTTYAEEGDRVSGGGGDDVLLDSLGVDAFTGGEGSDSLVYGSWVAVVDLTLGIAVSDDDVVDTVNEVENVLASHRNIGRGSGYNADPVIRGDAGANVLVGTRGSDHIFGEGGADLVDGFCGTDELDGGPGSVDLASFRFSSGISADLSEGRARATGFTCNNTERTLAATLDGIESLSGGFGNDRLVGDAAGNLLFGSNGRDLLLGADGEDLLHGGRDRDEVDGGFGFDRCEAEELLLGCEAAPTRSGARHREVFELISRLERILEMTTLAERIEQMEE